MTKNKRWEMLNRQFDNFVRKIIRNPSAKVSAKEWREMEKKQKECYRIEAQILRKAKSLK